MTSTSSSRAVLLLVTAGVLLVAAHGRLLDFEADCGGKSGVDDLETAVLNRMQFASTFAKLLPGDTLLVPGNKVFHVQVK